MMKTQPLCPEGEEPARAARLAVQRAAAELRRGEAIVIAMAGREALIAIAAELAGRPDLVRLRAEGAGLLLALTSERAAALGLADGGVSGTIAVPLGPRVEPAEIVAIADPSRPVRATAAGWAAGPPLPASATVAAAVRMMRIARLLPAALVVPVTAEAVLAAERDLIVVDVDDLARYDEASASALAIVGEARVPLAGAETARLIAFRPQDGGNEHLAVVIGTPEPGQPVLARIHSECFTGDFLGSLRCDCGDQLRGAIAAIGAAGSGVLIYLAQEGRGIGLINKLKAYELQDRGRDTVDANRALGFAPDERIFAPAAEMLKALGMVSVRLMTNNPGKVEALARHGVRVVERVPHRFPANGHNEPYLKAKARGLGHLI